MTTYDLDFTFNGSNNYSGLGTGANTIEEVKAEIKRQYDYFTWYPNMTVVVSKPCVTCQGKGEVPRTKKRTKFNWWDTVPCKQCQGKGRSIVDENEYK